jgi:hypothetical protein
MRGTTHARTQNHAGPPADAGPYGYDLPVARGGAQPLPASRPAGQGASMSATEGLVSFALSFGLLFIRYPSGLLFVRYSLLACAALVVVRNLPRRGEGFPRWALKIGGVLLNCYVGFLTVPALLRGALPEPLAFGLPAFLVTAALYCASPVNPSKGREWSLRQWLLWAGLVATGWGFIGPSFLS